MLQSSSRQVPGLSLSVQTLAPPFAGTQKEIHVGIQLPPVDPVETLPGTGPELAPELTGPEPEPLE